jgi:uncharacterized membrane protein
MIKRNAILLLLFPVWIPLAIIVYVCAWIVRLAQIIATLQLRSK